jgi:AraC-like DNA-binding protein
MRQGWELHNFLTYSERPAPRDLLPWVASYWRIAGVVPAGVDVQHRVLPDGCADLLFDLQAARDTGGEQGLLVGPMLAAQTIALRGPIEMIGVRFRPGGASHFLGIPVRHLRDHAAPLSELPWRCRVNAAQLAEVPNPFTLFEQLTGALRRGLPDFHSPDWVVDEALIQLTVLSCGRAPAVSSLARSIGVSERALERRFTSQVGLAPVQYRRLARFRAALKRFSSGCNNWSDIAVATGFSDQPHLVREFRAWAGISPTEWAATQASNVGFVQDGHLNIS